MADHSKIRLSSGRDIYAYGKIIGIEVGGDDFMLCYGYDGYLRTTAEVGEELTREELVEVADMMISRWTAARDAFAAGKTPPGYGDDL
jgi:hypothetical protein